MAGSYELWLTTDKGVRIMPLDRATSFVASRVANRIGSFAMELPKDFDTNYLDPRRPDKIVQIWRAPPGGRLYLWRPYFVRRFYYAHDKKGNEILRIGGPDCNDLLRRRIVANYAGSTEAQASDDEADDMMKRIITDALLDSDPATDAGTRALSLLGIQYDLSAGPQLTKGYAWQKLLTPTGTGILPSLAGAAREAGTEVFFDIVPYLISSTSIEFEFRTYTGQLGRDCSSTVTFSQETGNLLEPSIEFDWTEEENYIYAGGQGEEEEREIQQVYDSDRYGLSIWNRCEGFADARNQEDPNAVREAGRAQLEAGRPVRKFRGIPVDTAGTRFGRDWDFGYKVRASYRNFDFDCIIRSVVLNVTPKQETISTYLEWEST